MGQLLPPEFENDDVMCCFPAKYPTIFALAFGARITLTLSLKRRKNRLRRVKNTSFWAVHPVLPPSGKNRAGAHLKN